MSLIKYLSVKKKVMLSYDEQFLSYPAAITIAGDRDAKLDLSLVLFLANSSELYRFIFIALS